MPAQVKTKKGVTSSMSVSRETLLRELTRLGLSAKESQVYLAALEYGAGTMLELARRTDITRSTVYEVIEDLLEARLMSSIERNGKVVYVAASPDRLTEMVKGDEVRAARKRAVIDQLMPELRTLIAAAPERPRVRFYEGLEGLEAMRQEFFAGNKKYELLMISAADDYHRIAGLARRLPHAKRLEILRGFERCIFTSERPAAELKKMIPPVSHIERYRIPEKGYPLAGEIAVYGSKLALLSYRGEVMGVLVDSPFLAQTMTSLFNLAWETAKKFEKFE